jgi:formate-dependent nitrite reductase membrane component NrfD
MKIRLSGASETIDRSSIQPIALISPTYWLGVIRLALIITRVAIMWKDRPVQRRAWYPIVMVTLAIPSTRVSRRVRLAR